MHAPLGSSRVVGVVYTNVQFSVLGPVRLLMDGTEVRAGQPRQRAVLASLLLRTGSPVSLRTLIDDVWGDEAPASAAGSVRTYVYRLRRLLSDACDGRVGRVDGGYRLRVTNDALDANRFKHQVSRARRARDRGDPAEAAHLFGEATSMWTGGALAGVPGPFADSQRGALDELRLLATEERWACEVACGRYAEALVDLNTLAARYPLRERTCELLMAALFMSGRQAEALTAFHRTSHSLRERLGVSPSPRLRQVHERILTGRFDPEAQFPGRRRAAPLAARSASPAVPAQLPADLPELAGRHDERQQVLDLFGRDAAAPPAITCSIGGMPGVGKTAFAVALAHQVADRFPDGLLFADLQGTGSGVDPREPADVLAEFLHALGIGPEAVPEGMRARQLLFRSLLARRRVLVVLDDARCSEQVKELIPGAAGCATLVTSRMQLHGLVAANQAVPMTLGPLGPYDARLLLSRRLGARRAAAEPEAVDALVRSADGLPLALAVAAARAAYRPRLRIADLIGEDTARTGGLDAFTCEEDPALDVRRSIARSYRMLDADSARTLRCLSALPGPDVALHTIAETTGLSRRRIEVPLSGLARAHLAVERAPGRYGVHRLVAAYARERAHDHDERCGH